MIFCCHYDYIARQPVSPLIGQSPAIEALRSNIRRLADTDLVVLIRGENGAGKEVGRPGHPFPQPPPRSALRDGELCGQIRGLSQFSCQRKWDCPL